MACLSPLTVQSKVPYYRHGRYTTDVYVPCGRCAECRKRKTDEWAFRLMQEAKDSEITEFVTLTYNTDNVPITKNKYMTLEPEDITAFLNKLRKHHKRSGETTKVKFFLCGEYGGITKRPHYHAIIFNASRTSIEKAWATHVPKLDQYFPMGKIHFGDSVSSDACAYTVKYLDKGKWTPDHVRDDRKPEFQRQSNNLGIGYLTPQMIAWHKADLSRNYVLHGQIKIALPKVFRDRIYSDSEKQKQRSMIEQSIDDKEWKERLSLGMDKDEYETYRAKKNFTIQSKFDKNVKRKKRGL